jgi:hypothetical protein
MASLLRIALDIFDVDSRMSNAAFEQRRVPVIGTQGQGDFQLAHGRKHYRMLSNASTAYGLPLVRPKPQRYFRSAMTRKLYCLILLLVEVLIGSAPAPAQTAKIHVSAPSKSLSWFPIHLTREKGFYRSEGLDVDYVLMKPQLAMQALITGDVGYHRPRLDHSAAERIPLPVVMTIADKPLFTLITRPGIQSVQN